MYWEPMKLKKNIAKQYQPQIIFQLFYLVIIKINEAYCPKFHFFC